MFHQDWEPVIVRKKPDLKDPNVQKETIVKDKTHEARSHMNKFESDIRANPKEEAPAVAPLNILSPAMRQSLIQARVSLKINQIELAKQLCVKQDIIHNLETGKPIQDKSILQKLQRKLGISLKFGN